MTAVDNGVPAPTGAAALLSLTQPDEKASTAVTTALKQAGLNTTGLSVAVFPISGSTGQLLVIDGEITAPAFSGAGTSNFDQKKMAQAVLAVPKSSNITRLALNVRGRDQQGAYIITMTMTTATLDAMAKGTLSDADAQKQTQTGVIRK